MMDPTDDDLFDFPDCIPTNQAAIDAHKTFLAALFSDDGKKRDAADRATQTEPVKPLKGLRSIGTQTNQGDWFSDEISATELY